MTRQRSLDLSLYGLYAGVVLIAGSAIYSLTQRGAMSTPVFVAMLVGVGLVLVSFLASGAVSGRQAKYGSNALLMVVLFGLLLSGLYYLLNRYPQRFDLTKEGLFTLSEQSIQIVRKLDQPVKAIAFMTPGESDEYTSVDELLKSYDRLSDNFTAEIVDPTLNPVRARDLKIQELGTVVFLAGEGPEPKRLTVSKSEYVQYDYASAQMGQRPTSKFKGEEAFTTALMNVTGGEKKKVYFLAGHDEYSMEGTGANGIGQFKEALESENYIVETLFLSKVGQVPQDCAALVIAGPKVALLPLEAQVLVNYVKGGGKLLVLPNVIGTPGLNEVVGPFGVKIGNDVIFDPGSYLARNAPLITVASAYEFHEITDKMSAYSIFPAARSIDTQGVVDPWKASALIKTTDAAWAETDPQMLSFQPGVETTGSLSLMVLVEGPASDVPREVKLESGAPQLPFGQLEAPTPVPTVPAAPLGDETGLAPAPDPATDPAANPAQPAGQPADATPVPPAAGEAAGAEPVAPASAPAEAAPAPTSQPAAPQGGQGGGSAEVPTPVASAESAEAPTPATSAGSSEVPPVAGSSEVPPVAGSSEVPTAVASADGTGAPTATAASAGGAAASTIRWSDQGRLAIIGASAVITDDVFLQGSNRDLAMNTVGWLVGKRELISIRSKDTQLPRLTLNAPEIENIWWITIVFLPGLILIVGLSVWFQRR